MMTRGTFWIVWSMLAAFWLWAAVQL